MRGLRSFNYFLAGLNVGMAIEPPYSFYRVAYFLVVAGICVMAALMQTRQEKEGQ